MNAIFESFGTISTKTNSSKGMIRFFRLLLREKQACTGRFGSGVSEVPLITIQRILSAPNINETESSILPKHKIQDRLLPALLCTAEKCVGNEPLSR